MRKITILLFLLCIAVNVSFADSESDFEFTSYSDKKIGKYIQITKYIGNKAKCEIPGKIGNYPVLEIYCEDSLFAQKNKITELVLPNSLKKIGDNTFKNQNIKTVTIPSSLETIGREAFADCGIQNLIVLPRTKNLRFKAGAFKNNHLTKLDFPSNVDYIFENGEELSAHTWGISDVSNSTYPNPVFSGNDFESFVIEPNWYSEPFINFGNTWRNYSGAIDYEDWRGKLQKVVYKSGCKSLSVIASKTVKSISIPKSIGIGENGKPLKQYHGAEWCTPNMTIDGIKYEKGTKTRICARLKEKITSLQKLKLEDDGITLYEVPENADWYFDEHGEKVGAYTDSRK